MTKEQILEKQLRRYILGIKDISHGTDAVPAAIYNSMEEYTTQQVTAEREKWEAEKKEILSAVARGERLSEELRIDGPSLLEQEREKAAKLVEAVESIALKMGHTWPKDELLKIIHEYNANTSNR